MYLKGKSVLKGEVESCQKIPKDQRLLYKNHIMIEEGEGEPHPIAQEIIIQKQYDAKYLY